MRHHSNVLVIDAKEWRFKRRRLKVNSGVNPMSNSSSVALSLKRLVAERLFIGLSTSVFLSLLACVAMAAVQLAAP